MISSYYLFDDGNVAACGSNSNGQLGDGSNDASSKVYAAVKIPSGDRIYQVNSGPSSKSVFFIAHTVTYGAGQNDKYQLGVGNTSNQYTPTKVLDEGARDLYEMKISSSSSHTTASICERYTSLKPVWIPIFAKSGKGKSSKGKSAKGKSSKAFHSKSSKWSKYGKGHSKSSKSSKWDYDIQYLQVMTDFTPVGEEENDVSSGGPSRRRSSSSVYTAVGIVTLSVFTGIIFAVL